MRSTVLHRVGVDDRLEGRSRLTNGLGRAIELAVVEIATADQRADRAGVGIHRDERALQVRRVCLRVRIGIVRLRHHLLIARVRERPILPGLDRANLTFQVPLGGALHVEIERRVDLETLFVELFAELVVELLADPFDEIRCDLAAFDARRETQRIGLRFVRGARDR